MSSNWFVSMAVGLLIAPAGFAAVAVQEQSQTTTNQAGEVRTEVVQQVAAPDGGLQTWRQDVRVARETAPGVTEATREIRQRDLKGGLRLEARQTSTTTKTPTGEITAARQYRRDAGGNMQLSAVVEETTQKTTAGASSTRVERVPDINGNLVRQREVQKEIKSAGENEQTSEVRVRSFDPVAGEFRLTSIETTRTKQVGNTTQAETITRDPGNGTGRVIARQVTTSQTLSDGALQSETIQYGLSQHARGSSSERTELVPQQKTVDRVVRQPDGTTTVQREFYRRDVNQEWQPITIYPDDRLPRF